MMNMSKITLLLFMGIGSSLFGMKRLHEQGEEEEAALAAKVPAVEEEPIELARIQIEPIAMPSGQFTEVNPEMQAMMSDFEKLPNEIKRHIFDYLFTARGPDKRTRLYNAAQNIRNFMSINKEYGAWFTDEQTTKYLIEELAKRYTHYDIPANEDYIEAAIALGTKGAQDWFRKNIKIMDEDLQTLPHQRIKKALREGQVYVVSFILKSLDPDIAAVTAYFDLCWAIRKGKHDYDVAIVQTALAVPEMRELINGYFESGQTPLLIAIYLRAPDIVNLLIEAGADVNQTGNVRPTPLGTYLPAMKEAFTNVSPLILALWLSEFTTAELLLKTKKVAVNTPLEMTHNNRAFTVTPLTQLCTLSYRIHHAGMDEDYYIKTVNKLVDMLIEAGADINLPAMNGKTPLMIAVGMGNKSLVQKLLAKGAEVNQEDEQGHTALEYIRQGAPNAQEIETMLRDLGAHLGAAHHGAH